jgi:hypothetical protein
MVGMGLQRVAHTFGDLPWVAVQVDMRNAFHSVDRSTMLLMAHKKAPAVYNWLAWCYGAPTPLFCQGQAMTPSTSGVHQGDAMGPVGFALALEHALDVCSVQEQALPWCAWYLDDGLAVGPAQAVADYLAVLVPALSAMGLDTNLAKCSLWGPGVQGADDMSDLLPD